MHSPMKILPTSIRHLRRCVKSVKWKQEDTVCNDRSFSAFAQSSPSPHSLLLKSHPIDVPQYNTIPNETYGWTEKGRSGKILSCSFSTKNLTGNRRGKEKLAEGNTDESPNGDQKETALVGVTQQACKQSTILQ